MAIFCKWPHHFKNCIKIYWLCPQFLYSNGALQGDNSQTFSKARLVPLLLVTGKDSKWTCSNSKIERFTTELGVTKIYKPKIISRVHWKYANCFNIQCTSLTLKAPNKNCNFIFYFYLSNKAWFFMRILCLLSLKKQWKNIYECCLLQLWLAL